MGLTEAIEAAAEALCYMVYDESEWYCETHGNEVHIAGLRRCEGGRAEAERAVTAAAPIIARQVAEKVAEQIESARDWRANNFVSAPAVIAVYDDAAEIAREVAR